MAASEKVVIELDLKLDDGSVKKATASLPAKFEKAGKKSGKRFSKGMTKGMGGLKKTLVGLGGAFVAAFAFKKVIQAASIQEDAINSLNNALKISGKFTDELSNSIQTFASDIQKNSRFGDEIILQNTALIQSLGNLEEDGLKSATQAAVDMAAALKIDLRSAATLVGKAAAGEVSSFSRYGVIIKKGADNATTFANALTALNGKFGGAAAGDVKTFSGAYEQMSNTFGDLLEEVGFIVTKSPLATALIEKLNVAFASLITKVNTKAGEGNLLKDFIVGALNVGKALNDYVILPFTIVKDVATLAFKTLRNGVQEQLNFLVNTVASVADKINFGGVLDGFVGGLKDAADISSAVTKEMRTDLKETFKGSFDTSFSDGAEDFLNTVINTVEEVNEATKNVVKINPLPEPEVMAEQSVTFMDMLTSMQVGFDNSAKSMASTAKKLGDVLKQTLGKGISGGVQNLVNSLMNGQNAFKNFGKFVIGIMGDMAIQMGSVLISTGIGVEALKSLGGGAAIAAGVGLVALGTVMKSLAGGGGSTPATASDTSSGSGTITDTVSTEQLGGDEAPKAGSTVNLTVQGNILDRRESGLELANILNSAIDNDSVVINQSFA